MREVARPGVFVGRRREVDQLTALVDAAREGRSGVAVLRADPGMGKTSLLAAAVRRARGHEMQVVTISGVETEMVLDFAGLQRICAQLGIDVDTLSDIQRTAMTVALGVQEGNPPDPFLVGLAMVNLVSDAGATRPLLCIVDDAHCVDAASRQALGFAARRLWADHVAVIFATRASQGDHLDGLTEIRLGPLDDADSRALLRAVWPGRMDIRVRERLLSDAGGNPLALIELPATLPPAELTGGYGLTRAVRRRVAASGVEDVFADRYRMLPVGTRLLLLTAAVEPVGDPAWLWAAAQRLGLDVTDADTAEAAGLIDIDARIRFRHPLICTAILKTAPIGHRHRVHAALAEVIEGPDVADYRTWHRAHATGAPSEEGSTELVEAAQRAQRRGGVAAAAAFLEHAVELTPDHAVRAARALRAATAKLDAGDIAAATHLMRIADSTADPLHQARVALLRARLAFAGDRGREGPRLLLMAAQALADVDTLAARETYLEALMASMIVGRLSGDADDDPRTIALHAEQAPPAPVPPRAVDLLLNGLVVRLVEDFDAAAPLLANALQAYLQDVRSGVADPRWHDVTNRICLDLFDFEAYRTLAVHQLAMLKAQGELTVLPAALTTMAAVHVLDGRFDDGQALLDEASLVSSATGAPPHQSIGALLAGHRGDETAWRSAVESTVHDAENRGEGTEVTVALFSQAVLNNGLARYVEALDACQSGRAYDDVGLYGCVLIETAEAATQARDDELARDVAEELHRRAQGSGTEPALGFAARARAMADDTLASDTHFQLALAHLGRSPLAVYRARTHLVYGEWLRHNGRHADARTQLRLAHDACAAMGAQAFAQRAARELHAAGSVAGSRARRYDDALTTQERHIARLARQGYTNSEIGAQLLISHRTVEWHLRNVYDKLGIKSRRQLRQMTEPDLR